MPYTSNTRRKGAPGVWSGTETASAAAAVDPAMARPIWAMIANHYTQRRGLDAPYLTRIAARFAPEGGGGDYGPNSGGYDQLGFGTLAFTRPRATVAETTASPAPSTAASGGSTSDSASATPSSAASPLGGKGDDLAATGSSDLPAWTAATGVAALAGGLLLLRRRGQARRDAEQ